MRYRLTLITVVSILVALAAAAAAFYYLYTTADQTTLQKVNTEAMKVLMQFAALVLIGGFVTWALNQISSEKEQRMQRQDALNEFRRSAVTRVVTATNDVRKAPILIESHRSKKTYGEQARTLLDASLELRLLRHELGSAEEAFTNSEDIQGEIRKMESYLDGIVDEWKARYKDLPEPSDNAWGKIKSLRPPPDNAWDKIKSFPKLGDLRQGDGKSNFYKVYLSGHREALRLMRKDILGRDNRPSFEKPTSEKPTSGELTSGRTGSSRTYSLLKEPYNAQLEDPLRDPDKAFGDLDEREYRAELDLVDRYQSFVAELLRLSLAGIAVFGFLFEYLISSKSPEITNVLAAIGVLMFGISAAAALVFRFFAAEGARFYIEALRFTPAKKGRARKSLDIRDGKVRICRTSKWIAAVTLAAGGMLEAGAFFSLLWRPWSLLGAGS